MSLRLYACSACLFFLFVYFTLMALLLATRHCMSIVMNNDSTLACRTMFIENKSGKTEEQETSGFPVFSSSSFV